MSDMKRAQVGDNKFEDIKFQDDLGINARIERKEETNEGSKAAAARMREAGELLKPTKHVAYVGSATVHIYQSELLKTVFYITQTGTLGACAELTADGAMSQLRKDMMLHYGRKPGVKRSGF